MRTRVLCVYEVRGRLESFVLSRKSGTGARRKNNKRHLTNEWSIKWFIDGILTAKCIFKYSTKAYIYIHEWWNGFANIFFLFIFIRNLMLARVDNYDRLAVESFFLLLLNLSVQQFNARKVAWYRRRPQKSKMSVFICFKCRIMHYMQDERSYINSSP